MWSVGFNVSREVLLAIRQSNNQRVEHLVEGLVNALRHHREARLLGATDVCFDWLTGCAALAVGELLIRFGDSVSKHVSHC